MDIGDVYLVLVMNRCLLYALDIGSVSMDNGSVHEYHVKVRYLSALMITHIVSMDAGSVDL
jgi:hypothetical protein